MKVLSRQILIISLALIFTAQKCGDEKVEFLPKPDISTLERAEYTKAGPVAYDLITAENMKIGEVILWNTAETLFVKYTIENEDMCLTATQLHVGDSTEEIPTGSKGNPSPLQYEYQDEHDCETEIIYEIDLSSNGWECGNQLEISTHAVVSTQRKCDAEALIFGVESETGAFYSIDLNESIATLLFDVEKLAQEETKTPTGLAYNEYSQKLYFAICDQQTTDRCALFFFDGTDVKEAGLIEGKVSGATFFEGQYYFINDATNSLNRAFFDENGKVTSVESLCPEFSADSATWKFNDIVISYDGVSFYGIATDGNNHPATLHAIDLMSCKYTPVSLDSITVRQLAYGSDGSLHGYNATNKEFYELIPDADTIFRTGTLINIEQEFKSLASGPFCIPQEEEVWSTGDNFQGNNSGTFFTYEVTCNDECSNWESAIAWGGPNEGDGTPEWFYLDATGEKPQQLYTREEPIQGSKIYYIDGELSIETGPSVILKKGTETVRINGYYEYTLPAERPDTDLFEIKRDHDYSLLNMNVGYYDYLVIWMDVWICRE